MRAASGQVFDLAAGYGLVAAAGDPLGFTGAANITSDQLWFVRLWIPAGNAITNLWVAVKTGGTHDGATSPNQLGLYTNAGVRVDATANDATLWAAAGWCGGALASGPVAAQDAGRMVYVALLVRGAAVAPTVCFCAAPADATPLYAGPATTARRCFYSGGQAALPANVNPAADGTATGYVPLFAAN